MGRRRITSDLAVAMNGLPVGTWTRTAQGEHRFRYADSWLREAGALPLSLSMPLSDDVFRGETVRNWFDNLLPDSAELRRRLQGQLAARSTQPFDLLTAMGADCVGALQIHAPDQPPQDVRRVTADPVDEATIAATLRDQRERPLGMSRDGEFRISIAGAQAKTALLWLDDRWHRPRGATPTSHILKLPIGPAAHGIDMTDSVENEWLCTQLVRAFGLPAPNVRIQRFEDQRALVVERFDRAWSKDRSWLMRLHQEDFCQALGVAPGIKYESDGGPGVARCFELLRGTLEPEAERRRFFRTLVVFWLLGGIDGHAKNFSLFLLPGGRSRATPVYDVLSAWPVVARRQLHQRELKMAMAVWGENRHYAWSQIRPRHWLITAKAVGLPTADAQAELEDVRDTGPSALARVAAALPSDFPAAVAAPILDGVGSALQRLGEQPAD